MFTLVNQTALSMHAVALPSGKSTQARSIVMNRHYKRVYKRAHIDLDITHRTLSTPHFRSLQKWMIRLRASL